MDYSIYGVKTFSNIVGYSILLKNTNIVIRALAYIAPISLVIMFIAYIVSVIKSELRKNIYFRNLYLLLVYSFATAIVIFPISDKTHFAIGSMCSLISCVYLIYKTSVCIITKLKKDKLKIALKTFIKAVTMLIFLIYIAYSIFLLTIYALKVEKHDNLKHFNYMLISDVLYERIQTVNKYLEEKEAEGKKVYILDSMSSVFNIPRDKYYKNYDMFNLGNFGDKGETRNNRRFK